MSAAANTGALNGLKVIDLSRVLGGPFAGQILGDHGADVIKVEPPAGDETRAWGPPFEEETASYFMGLNRNKRALALDLSRAEGRSVLLRLLEGADVLLENFKTGTLEKWGIGYDVLSARFPALIHCRVSGFGADGPLGGLPGYDAILQAMGGLMSVNGGRGQFVEAALFDSALSLLHPHAANYVMSGKLPSRTGNDHPNIAPYSTYATGGRPIYLSVGNNRQFACLCQVIGADQIATDPRFATNGARVQNRAELREALETALVGFDGADLAQELIRSGVPAGPVLDVGEALAHPHTAHRDMTVEIDGYRGLGSPVKPAESPASFRRKPPKFAEHMREILTEAGYTPDEIDAFAAQAITPTGRLG